MTVTYSIFEDVQGQQWVSCTTDEEGTIATAALPRTSEGLPDFLLKGEVGQTFSEDGKLLDDESDVDLDEE